MNTKTITAFQVFLRIALSISFLSAVADRFGFWGAPGAATAVWGNWENFVAYTQSVNSFASPRTNNLLAMIATALEILLPLLLLTGYKIRLAAMGSGILLLSFGLSMTYSFGIKPSLNYSVWTAAGASFLLSSLNSYRYSIDYLITKK